MTVSGFASPTGPPLVGEDGKREWVYAAEGAKAETQGPWPDIENTRDPLDAQTCRGISFETTVEKRRVGWGGGCEIGTDTGNG